MKHLWIILFLNLFLLNTKSFSQSKKKQLIDSLQSILQDTPIDTLQVDVLNELAWIYRNNNYQKSFEYGNQARELADKHKYDKGLATAHNRLGLVCQSRGKYLKALNHYRIALKIEKKIKHLYGMSRAKNQISSVYILMNEYRKAIPQLEESLELLKKGGLKSGIASKKINLAICHKNLGNLDKAISFYLSALESLQNLDNHKQIGECYLGLGILYQDIHNFSISRKYLIKAQGIFEKNDNKKTLAKVYNQIGIFYLKVKDYETSLNFFQKALELKISLKTSQDLQLTYNNLGQIHYHLANYDQSLKFLMESLELSAERKDTATMASVYNNLGVSKNNQKKYKEGIEFLLQGLAFSQQKRSQYNRRNVLKNLGFAYSQLGDYEKAFWYLKQYNMAKDSIEMSARQAMNIKDKYEAEKKKRELAEKDTEIQKSQLVQQTLLNYILGIGLLLSLIVVLAIVRTYQDKRKVRKKQQKIDDLLHEQEFLALSKMLEGQEQERNRVAQDLHDRLGGILSVLKIRFVSLRQFLSAQNQPATTSYQQAQDLIEEAVTSVRAIAHDMSSKALERFGLIPALEDLKSNIEESRPLEVDLIATGFDNRRLPAKYETQVYRIIQELISNILKHAQAREVEMQLIWKEGNLHIGVEDDGQGFDKEKALRKKGLGLGGMQSRIKALMGEYVIESSEGNGTQVMIDIPLPTLEEPPKELTT